MGAPAVRRVVEVEAAAESGEDTAHAAPELVQCPFDPGMVIGYKEPYVSPSGLRSLVLASSLPVPILADGIDVAPPHVATVDLVEIGGPTRSIRPNVMPSRRRASR